MKWFLAALALAACLFAAPAQAQIPSLTLEWNAPGDDGNVGTAALYEMKYATTRPDTTTQSGWTAWWSTATAISGMPTPLVAGTMQTVTVSPAGGFIAGNTYFFAMRSRDEAGNWSTFSNVAFRSVLDTTAPGGSVNLRVR